MINYEHLPLTLIALSCDLAKSGVFLKDTLQFYVRDGGDRWLGYMRLEEELHEIEAPTLDELAKKLKEYYESQEA